MSKIEASEVSIREMAGDDYAAITAIAEDTDRYKQMVRADITERLDFSFVAEISGRVVGFILAQLEYILVPFTEVCVIHAIAVRPEYRRLGVGTKLVSELEHQCSTREVTTMRALVPLHDTELRGWVEALGFRRSTIINYDKTSES